MINISSNRSDNKCLITSQEVDNLQKSLNPSYVCKLSTSCEVIKHLLSDPFEDMFIIVYRQSKHYQIRKCH